MNSFITPAAEEWIAIHNLYAFYNLCSDTGDAHGFASCFADDGVLDQVSRRLVLRGRQSILEYKRKEAASRNGKYRRHWNSGLFLDKQADGSVRGWCYLHAYNGDPGWLPVKQGAGVYDDLIVPVGKEWKFQRRILTMDARVEPTVQFSRHAGSGDAAESVAP
ncbi:nuclear transport factor 2 family protein [Alcaligenaceae bacterium]|uniref:nuclear transport factor 2 family protein n=1 Tax=Parapusillimonas sp. JC17 TaxID=3445768 RepID=UPI0015D1C660|nr:nuclear transport factor 2 family protein [Alcaligenaceae bacterium]